MRSILVILTLLVTNFLCNTDGNEDIIVNLYGIQEMPYLPELSGDSIYWVVIQRKLEVIPHLIEKLDDT
ncbi:MAG: hypothetical protein JKX76_03720, partial [Colwellia sp.]|nr:hypothetical protein [Colwellia sp.]